jgi:hypothetical protein
MSLQGRDIELVDFDRPLDLWPIEWPHSAFVAN